MLRGGELLVHVDSAGLMALAVREGAGIRPAFSGRAAVRGYGETTRPHNCTTAATTMISARAIMAIAVPGRTHSLPWVSQDIGPE